MCNGVAVPAKACSHDVREQGVLGGAVHDVQRYHGAENTGRDFDGGEMAADHDRTTALGESRLEVRESLDLCQAAYPLIAAPPGVGGFAQSHPQAGAVPLEQPFPGFGGQIGHAQRDVALRNAHIGQRQAPNQPPEGCPAAQLYPKGQPFQGPQKRQPEPGGPISGRQIPTGRAGRCGAHTGLPWPPACPSSHVFDYSCSPVNYCIICAGS